MPCASLTRTLDRGAQARPECHRDGVVGEWPKCKLRQRNDRKPFPNAHEVGDRCSNTLVWSLYRTAQPGPFFKNFTRGLSGGISTYST